MPTSTEVALNVNELLERIISSLPFEDIVTMQRVCKHWQALIAGSRRLQRAIFRAPEMIAPVEFSQSDVPQYDEILTLHPSLARDTGLGVGARCKYNRNSIRGVHFGELLKHYRSVARVDGDDTDDSWSHKKPRLLQHITQPACTTAFFLICPTRLCRIICVTGSICNESGVTFSDVLTFISSVFEQQSEPLESSGIHQMLEYPVLFFDDLKTSWTWPTCAERDTQSDADFTEDSDESDSST